MKRRLLSAALVLCMALNLLPLEAIAADTAGNYTPPVVSQLYYVSDPGTAQEQKTQILNPSSPLNIVPTASFAFEVQFVNPEYVGKVYITSTVNGVTSHLEAQVNQAHNLWKTSGLFNGDVNYVPGTIGVEFTTHHGAITVTNTWNPVWDALKLSGITINNEQETEGATSFDVMLSGLVGLNDEYLSAIISESNGTDNAASEIKGWLEDLDSLVHFEFNDPEKGTDYIVYLGYPAVENQNCALIVKEVTGNKFTTMLIKKANGDLDAVANQLSTINTISSLYSDYYKISAESAVLKEQIAASSTMSTQEKIAANQKVDNLDNDKKLFSLFTTVLPLIAGTAAGGPAALLFSALLSSITATSDYFWDYRVGLIEGCDPIENAFTESSDHPGWIELTGRTIQESGTYFLTGNLGSLTINENAKVTLCLHGNTISGVIMKSGATLHIRDCKYVEHDDGSVTGGIISRTITMQGQNELTLEQGLIQGNYGHAIVSEGSGGKITINGGLIEGINGAIIADDGGNSEITINNGTLKSSSSMGTGIRVNDGSKLTVNDGTLNGSITTHDPNGNSSADIRINGGEITGSISAGIGTITVNMRQGFISGGISGETVNFQKGVCTGTVSGENVTITGGEVGRVTGANITIEDGTISNGATFSSYGSDATRSTAVINGGTIYGNSSNGIGIDNYRNSRLTINGGTIYGGITNANTAQLTITSGTIYGGITNNNSSTTTLLIQNGSDIQVSGSPAFNKVPAVGTNNGYSGGVTYYNSANTQGIPMTIEEATTADYTGSYARLVAGGTTSGNDNKITVATSPSTAGNVTYTPSDPTDGDTVTITVTPETGYQGGTPVVKDASGNNINVTDGGNGKYTFVMPAGNVTITPAEFTPIVYNVTAPVSTPNGSVTLSATTAKKGDTVTITVTPDASYQGGVPTVTDADGNTITVTNKGSGTYSFVMPASNVTIIPAEFTSISYTVTAPASTSNGTVTLSATTAAKGSTVTITVSPNDCYKADTPVVTGSSGSVKVTKVNDTTYTFTMPGENVTVSVSFVSTLALAYTPYANMTDADKKLYYGGKLEITGLVPNTKYVVTFDNGLAAPTKVNGRDVIPRIAHVVTSDASGKITLGCQDSMNVMVFGVSGGGNVTTDLVELYAKNHAGVSVKSLNFGNGT